MGTAGPGSGSQEASASELGRRALRALADLAAASRLRSLVPSPHAPDALDLTHNDYLGLRDDEGHQAALRAAAFALPCGAGASRLLGGEHPIFSTLERAFAAFKQADASLYFPSGYAANESVITTLARLPGTAFFSDALNHASLIDGFRLAALPAARKAIYRHADVADLEARLRASDAPVNVIVSETVFSMDGDIAPLGELARLAAAHRGVLVLDEAHAVFALGEAGRGLATSAHLGGCELITVDTCGKALGAQGAFVSGPAWLRELLVNWARPFIYTTAASPWIAAALLETLARAPLMQARRERLASVHEKVRAGLLRRGLDLGGSKTHIIPILLGDDAAALAWSARLAAQRIHARAIRPPTVPEGGARLRLSLHAAVTDEQIERLIAAFP